MSTMDDVISKTKEIAEAAGKKTGEVVDMAKLNYSLSETRSEIKKVYCTIGESVYRNSKDNSQIDFSGLFAKLDGLFVKRREIEEKLVILKKTRKCPACGASNSKQAVYCQACGKKISD